MTDGAKISWVNHASYVLERSGVALLTDPWFEGMAFVDGWALCSPTRRNDDLLQRITHIWISHEHPDHFSPATLRSIPSELRRNITVLYQLSRDHKVIDFCEQLGFAEVREMRANEWVQLATDFRIMCNPWRLGDSYLVAETPEGLVLNVNDCVIRTRREAESILDDLSGRSPKVLLTQYSYANRIGNPDQTDLRRQAARAELDSVVNQASVLRPEFVVPFASFFWFCHQENGYLNDALTTATDAVRLVEERTESIPIVLYPGEQWSLGKDPPSAHCSAGRYDSDLADRLVDQRPSAAIRSVPLATLIEDGNAFSADLVSINGRLQLWVGRRLGPLRPVRVWVSDLGVAVLLSYRGIRPVTRPQETCDIAVGSEPLEFLLHHRFGGMTLFITGRFVAPGGGRLQRIIPLVNLREANNRGIDLVGWLRGRLFFKLEQSMAAGSRTARWLRRHQ